MIPVFFFGYLIILVSTAPLIPKVDELITDLNAAGNFMAAYVRTYPEYKEFYQLALPIAVTFNLPKNERKEAMMAVYKQFGPKNATPGQMENDVATFLSAVETSKEEYLTSYFTENNLQGLHLLSQVGYLFSQDVYLNAQFFEKKDMLTALIHRNL